MSRLSFLLVAGLMFAGCAFQHEKPYPVFAPDMHYNPSLKAQEGPAMRTPPSGTVPRGFRPYTYPNLEAAGKELKNPSPRSKAVFSQGKTLYNSYCIVCHGKGGEGDGSVVPKYPRPPSLISEKIRDYPDGSIFHVITMGQNLMPSYADRLDPEERWAVVHYLRALYRSKNPSKDDFKKAEGYVEEDQ